jgi:peptidoglycan-associated lipoprotein
MEVFFGVSRPRFGESRWRVVRQTDVLMGIFSFNPLLKDLRSAACMWTVPRKHQQTRDLKAVQVSVTILGNARVAKTNKLFQRETLREETMKVKSHWMVLTIALCMALVLVGASGCKHKKAEGPVVTKTTEKTSDKTQTEVKDINFYLSKMGKVYFDFDKSNLRPDAIEQLNKNAAVMKEGAQFIYQIAGHCDERGTQEYNLALGERRALAVRDYLISVGVPADRLVTISYGEEKPADAGHDEAAWGKNRRAEFNEGKK